jgi:Polyketide cyclase / dehydrase and lipid transport
MLSALPVAKEFRATVEQGDALMGVTTLVSITAAGAALFMSGLAAHALESSAKASSKLSADALWAKIGDFCGISKWHPAIEKCALSADGKTRTLSLKGGGTVVEALVGMNAAGRSYTYAIVSAPLPVANYTSTISVSADGAGAVVTWAGKYDAKGASDADAQKIIQGIYESGVKALTE